MSVSTHADFTGVPFMAGSIRGERSFRLRYDGYLQSPMKPFVWAAEENKGKCLKADVSIYKRLIKGNWPGALHTAKRFVPEGVRVFQLYPQWNVDYSYGGQGVGFLSIGVHWWSPVDNEHGVETVPRLLFEAALRDDHGHDFGTCSCGFYAYLNGCNEYEWAWSVTGIIEGYGETLIGDRGFRSAKARILALAAAETNFITGDIITRIRHRYPTVPIFPDKATLLSEFPTTDVTEFMEETA